VAIPRRKVVRRTGVVLALGVVLRCAWLWWLLGEHGTFTRANFDRIQNGMTVGEVEAILGPHNGQAVPSSGSSGDRSRQFYWDTDTAIAYVTVNEFETVDDKYYGRLPLNETLRRWLRRSWARAFDHKALF
jgi:hypothetical protein